MSARPWSAVSSSLAILLGVAAFVAIRHVTVFSEENVSEKLSSLGANILILPKGASLQDYYSADQNGESLPEENVSEVFLAGLTGVEKVTPKLNVPTKVADLNITLTGILPQSEFETQASWQTANLFSPKKHDGCKKAKTEGSSKASPESLIINRAIDKLESDEIVVGADVVEATSMAVGNSVDILGHTFTVLATLPRSGTIDDSRVFAHLHTVQEISGSGEVVNAIEVVGCCEDAAGDLVPQLGELLPHAKVVTISQVVQTQVGVNRLMANTSWLILMILAIVGGISLAGAIAANVRERRREIGTLMALGATPSFVLRMFLLKALVLGFVSGAIGCLLGMGSAILAGPGWAGVSVSPLPGTLGLSLLAAILIALLSAYWPARQASLLDPCLCFQEI